MAYAAAAGFAAAFVWICFLQNSPSPCAFSAFAEHSVFSQRTRSCFVSVSSCGCPLCGHESLDITALSLLWSLLQSCPSVCGRIRTNSSYFESWPPTCLWLHPTNHQRFALWSPLSPGSLTHPQLYISYRLCDTAPSPQTLPSSFFPELCLQGAAKAPGLITGSPFPFLFAFA